MPGRAKQNPREIFRSLGNEFAREAVDAGMNVSRYLERIDPSSDYPTGSVERSMSAYERQLEVADIVTRSDPHGGYQADLFGVFGDNDATRLLGMEFIARQFRAVRNMTRTQRRALMLGSDDYSPGSMMRPVVDAANELIETLEPAIPLGELIARTTQIDATSYRAMYIDWGDTDNYHYSRIAEGTDIPAVKIVSGEREIQLAKYGVKIVATYEQLRRTPIDVVALLLQRIAVQADVDKVSKIMDVMVNGDGNANTAAIVHTITSLGGTAGTITSRDWTSFLMEFRNPYRISTLLGRKDTILDLMLTPVAEAPEQGPTLGQAAGQIALGTQPFDARANVTAYIVDDAPADVVVGFDNRVGIERVTEIGGTIQEMQRWMQNQTEELYLTEVEGYRVFDNRAIRVFDTSA